MRWLFLFLRIFPFDGDKSGKGFRFGTEYIDTKGEVGESKGSRFMISLNVQRK